MESIFGTTPIGMLVLEFLLVPLLFWVGHKLNKVIKTADNCSIALDGVSERLDRLNGSLAKIQEEQGDTEVRLERIEGRIKGVDSKLERGLRS